MKKTISVCLIIITLTAFLCGCTQKSKTYDENNNVNLCDYHNLVIDESEYYVSEEDLNTAIEMNLNSIDLDDESVKLTDEIARQYFNSNNKEETIINIKREIIENRFCEAAIEKILTTSQVKILSKESETFVETVINSQKKIADEMGIEHDEYFKSNFDMTESEYCEALLDEYVNYMIISALAQKEGYTVSDTERSAIIEEIANNDEISEDKAIEIYGNEYFDFILYENFLKDYLTDVYSEQIEKAVC